MSYISFQPNDYFNSKIWTGTGSTNALTSLGFAPDWCWIKQRGGTTDHHLYDSLRGVTKAIASNNSDPESTKSTGLTAFGSDGFTLGGDAGVNGSSNTYASWNWKMGTTSGLSGGSITPSGYTISATAKQSIIKFTGTGSVATLPHGLSKTPSAIFVKNASVNNNWNVYHHSIGNTHRLFLDTTQGDENNASAWNDTSPTSSLFTVGTNTNVNQSGNTMVAYCFADNQGYFKAGKYIGNGSTNGTFIYLGFAPAMIIRKRSDATEDWAILDNKRLGYNPDNSYLFPNGTNAESAIQRIDFLSNGFKLRTTDGGDNASGATYVYMAWSAEALVSSNGVPATAK